VIVRPSAAVAASKLSRRKLRFRSGVQFAEGKRRMVPVIPGIVAMLKSHKVTQAAGRLRMGDHWRGFGLVFTAELGTPVEPRNPLRVIETAARSAGIEVWRADVTPAQKIAHIGALRAKGSYPLMVGDGLNDAAALAAAHASASPGTAVEASQAAADLVLQGAGLGVLIDAIDVARAARARSLENLGFSALYNLIAAPLAAFGFLTPLIAALAMSGSSLVVTMNALRLQLLKGRSWIS